MFRDEKLHQKVRDLTMELDQLKRQLGDEKFYYPVKVYSQIPYSPFAAAGFYGQSNWSADKPVTKALKELEQKFDALMEFLKVEVKLIPKQSPRWEVVKKEVKK